MNAYKDDINFKKLNTSLKSAKHKLKTLELKISTATEYAQTLAQRIKMDEKLLMNKDKTDLEDEKIMQGIIN